MGVAEVGAGMRREPGGGMTDLYAVNWDAAEISLFSGKDPERADEPCPAIGAVKAVDVPLDSDLAGRLIVNGAVTGGSR